MKQLPMKKLLLIAGLVFSFTFTLQAQNENRNEKVQALYVAYVTQQLQLKENEAQTFWPVHALFDGEITKVKSDVSELDRQQTVLNIKKKYQDRFSKILGEERTNKFFIIDTEFRKKMLERLKKLRQERGQGGAEKRLMPQRF